MGWRYVRSNAPVRAPSHHVRAEQKEKPFQALANKAALCPCLILRGHSTENAPRHPSCAADSGMRCSTNSGPLFIFAYFIIGTCQPGVTFTPGIDLPPHRALDMLTSTRKAASYCWQSAPSRAACNCLAVPSRRAQRGFINHNACQRFHIHW